VATADQIGAQLHGLLAQVAIDVILTLDKKLRITTPVDTGHARRNWISSVTQPFEGEVADEAANAAGLAAVLRYALELGPLWMANNAPYVQRLNDGWSQQQPAGFVERAIAETEQEVSERWAAKGIEVSGMFRP
jgi:hypothetical protein